MGWPLSNALLFILTSFVLIPGSFAAPEESQDGCLGNIFITGSPEKLQRTIDSRAHLYTPGLRDRWENLPAKYYRTADGEEILEINGLEVMREFENPYMRAIARAASVRGGRVLNVGFGLGHIDDHIESFRGKYGIEEHHIVELNKDVVRRAENWRSVKPNRDKIFLHAGDWNDVLLTLHKRGLIFDGIAYDAFPLEAQELHRDFIPFLLFVIKHRLIREHSGVITFYMDSPDGFGDDFKTLLTALGVGSATTERVNVQLPQHGNQYWDVPYFLTPSLTRVTYKAK